MNENNSSLREEPALAMESMPQKSEYKEPKNQILKNWDVNITTLDVGCIVRVGCRSFAFQSIPEALKELGEFYADPEASHNKWEKIVKENNN